MHEKFSGAMITVAIAATVAAVPVASAQAPAPSAATAAAAALKTPWGEPDFQGIWTDENDTPLQRPARFANQEFFTPAQRAELDQARTEVLVNADKRPEEGPRATLPAPTIRNSCRSSGPARARR